MDDREERRDPQDGSDQDEDGNLPRARRRRAEGMPLENLLRLLAGQRVVIERRGEAAASSNEELVSGLKRSGMLSSEAVTRAMLTVPRGSFVPPEYQNEAWIDSPIRVEEHDFNISAPHMHAQMLESLDIQPGDRVLDVGCGCGLLAACAAVMAGKSGTVVGVDIKPAAIQLSQDNISRLQSTSSSFASSACPVGLVKHNIFIPSAKLKGKFNKVVIGATCPEERLHLLLPLLDPSGGQLLAPVDNDLRLYTRQPDGRMRQRVVSSVRFSDLEVPSDASIALSVLKDEQASLMEIMVSPSTLTEDLAADLKGCAGGFMNMWSSCFNSFSSSESAHSITSSDSLPGPETPMMSAHKARHGHHAEAPAGDEQAVISSSAGIEQEAGSDDDMHDMPGGVTTAGKQVGIDYGEPDCDLIGNGWRLKAHKQVLKSRAAHFRARLSSGMRDAHDCDHKVPESFSLPCMESLLAYVYQDELPEGLDPPAVVELLHAASYYGTPRLIEMCEARLVSELLQLPHNAAAAEAPHLLSLADELGLIQLRRAAVAFIAQNYKEVQRSEAWQSLSRSQVELVTTQLATEMSRLKQLLNELEPPAGVTAAPKRRGWW